MGTKAPYQTKQMKQILSYLQTVEGTHVTVADVCCFFKGGDYDWDNDCLPQP